METLGTRIRKLRKEKKLTLEALAGNRLTKGMLSLIENDKAKPSIESLQYIAEQLSVEMSDLLEEVTPATLRKVLEDLEPLYTKTKIEGNDSNFSFILKTIEPYLKQMPTSYEAGRLLTIYAETLYFTKGENWITYLLQARSIFKEINLMSHWFTTYVLQLAAYSEVREYEKGLACIIEAEEEINRENYQLDDRQQGKMSYYLAVLQLAVGKKEAGLNLIYKAIETSHHKQLYYHIDDMYRIAAFSAMIDGDFELAEKNMRKLDQYSVFTEQRNVSAFIYMLKAHYNNNFIHDYVQAMNYLEKFKGILNDGDIMVDINFYYSEMGKSLYLQGKLQEARICFEKFEKIPAAASHPYDLLSMYECLSYKAKCYADLGELSTAFEIAKNAYFQVQDLVDLPYKKMIQQTYEDIKAQIDGKKDV